MITARQDWQISERLDAVRGAYARRGVHVETSSFEISIRTPAIGPKVVSSATVNTPTDSDWWWFGNSWTYEEATNANALLVGQHTVQIRLGARDRVLGNGSRDWQAPAPDSWIPFRNIFGQWSEPFLWPYPIAFTKGDFFRFDFFNGDAAATLQPFHVTFIGYKARRMEAAA